MAVSLPASPPRELRCWIHYWADDIGDGMAQLMCEVIIEGVTEQLYPTGEPGPMADIEQLEGRIRI